MKKIIPAFLAVVASVSTAFAQGTVNFNNGVAFGDGIDRYVYLDRVGGTPLVGLNWAAILVYGPSETSLNNFAQRNATNTTITSALGLFKDPALGVGAGTWTGGTRTLTNSVAMTGVPIGGTTMLQVRIWDVSAFATYDLAVAGQGRVGHSDAFSYTVPPAGSLPSMSFLNGLRAFALVPEPSTIVLGALGIASLLFLRRRK